MKQYWFSRLAIASTFMFGLTLASIGQDGKNDKGEKGEKTEKDKSERQQVIITTTGDSKDKVVVEISGDKVTVNGKPAEEYKGKDGKVIVNVNKLRDRGAVSYFRTPGAGSGGSWNFNGNDGITLFNGDENRAMLGVTTEKVMEGAEIQSITKESGAEKAGLKEKDIITKVDDKKVEGPDDLSEAIQKHKPGDKTVITYLRNKKEQKTTAELTKWKGIGAFGFGEGQNFKMNMDNFKFDQIMPKIQEYNMRVPEITRNFAWSGGSPKLGLSVQDTDDGKGVKVVNVLEESNAGKAGIKEDDIITMVDDKSIKGVDEIATILKEKKDNPTVRFQLIRDGKTQNIEVKMPRKIKTTNL